MTSLSLNHCLRNVGNELWLYSASLHPKTTINLAETCEAFIVQTVQTMNTHSSNPVQIKVLKYTIRAVKY